MKPKKDFLKALDIAIFGDIAINVDLSMMKRQNETRILMDYDE